MARWRGQLAVARAALDLLAGAPVPPELLPERLGLAAARALSPGLPSDVLLSRPDVLAAEHQLMAANANIGAARAAFFPRISLTAALGTLSPQLSSLFASGTRTWTFAPQATAPLWAGGYQRANLRLAKVERQIAVAQYEKAIQSAFAEVCDALSLRTTLIEQREAQEALARALDRPPTTVEARPPLRRATTLSAAYGGRGELVDPEPADARLEPGLAPARRFATSVANS